MQKVRVTFRTVLGFFVLMVKEGARTITIKDTLVV